jgi:hypothetical protein
MGPYPAGTDPQKDYLLIMIENLKGKIIDNFLIIGIRT